MTKSILILFFSLIRMSTYGQPSQGSILQLTYDYVNVGLSEKRTVTLYFRNQESLSTFSAKDSIHTGAAATDFNASGEDAWGRQVYKNTRTREVIFRDFIPVNGAFTACIVSDPMKPMTWIHSTETRTIGKHLCKAASTLFRGRKYVAWYTEEIPVSHGPWKFSGLPGAIVEVYSVDRNISFTLTRIASSAGEIEKPVQGNAVTMAYFATRREKSLDDLVNTLLAKMPRGAEISASSSGDYNLETDFSDVER